MCITQQIYARIAGFVWTYVGHMGCVIMHFVSFLNDFCPCILSLFCFVYRFHYILESVYWFHSIVVPLAYVPVWSCVLIWQVGSQWIICHILSVHEVISVANQNLLAVFSYYKIGRYFDIKSDLTELHFRKLRQSNILWAGETFCGRNFHEVWNTLHIYLIIFRVYIWGNNNVCKLINFHLPLCRYIYIYI